MFRRAAHLESNWHLGRYVNVGVTSGVGGANRSIVSLDVINERSSATIVDGGNADLSLGGLDGRDAGGGIVLTAYSDGFVRLWNIRGLSLRGSVSLGSCRRLRSLDYDNFSNDNDDDDDDGPTAPSIRSSSIHFRVQPTVVKAIPGRADVALVGCDDGRLRIISSGGNKDGVTGSQNGGGWRRENGGNGSDSQTCFDGVLCVSFAAHGDAITKLELKSLSPSNFGLSVPNLFTFSFSSSISSSSRKSSTTLAISVGADKSVIGWRIDTHAISLLWAKRGNEHDDDVECCALHFCDDKEGRQNTGQLPFGIFVTGSWDGRLVVRHAFTGDVLHILCGHLEAIHCVAIVDHGTSRFSGEIHDARGNDVTLISGSADGSLMMWNGVTGEPECLLDEVHTAEVYCVAANEDWIVSGGADSNIAVWTTQNGDLKHLLTPGMEAVSEGFHYRGNSGDGGRGGGSSGSGGGGGGHVGIVRSLNLGVGDRLVSAGDCRRVLVWDVRRGVLLHQIHRQPILVKEMVVTHRLVVTSSPENRGVVAVIAFW